MDVLPVLRRERERRPQRTRRRGFRRRRGRAGARPGRAPATRARRHDGARAAGAQGVMSSRFSRWWHVSGGLLVLLGIVAVTGIINFFVVNQRAFLNFYYLPVVVGAYLLGRWRGVYSALLSCTIVYAMAYFGSSKFAEGESWMLWLDLITWGVFLVLTSYVVGSLYDLKQAQLRELQQAYRGVLEIVSKFIDSIDRYTENHSRRVAEYAVVLARAMELPEP